MAIIRNHPIWHSVRTALSRLRSWETILSLQQQTCFSCGMAHKGANPLLPLCRACLAAIPWITEVVCAKCGRYESCPDCARGAETYLLRNRSAVRYTPGMKEWLALYKYRGRETMRQVIGPMLLHAYHLHGKEEPCPDFVQEMITFVPLSEERLSERGFNQAEQMAAELGKLTRLPVLPLLKRTAHTGKQSFKARMQRIDDLKGVFALEPRGVSRLQALIRGGPVRLYIVDDVYTTGSTLNECARTIRSQIEVQVCGLCWAR